jgi:esterase/lipase
MSKFVMVMLIVMGGSSAFAQTPVSKIVNEITPVEANGFNSNIISMYNSKFASPRPVLYFIGGIGCYSFVQHLDLETSPYWAMIREAVDHGYQVSWTEKPLKNNANQKECTDMTFLEEEALLKVSLEKILESSDIDKNRMVAFGHSMGGIFAARLGQNKVFKSILVSGTLNGTWYDYDIRNTKRQLQLSGIEGKELEDMVARRELAMNLLLIQKETPEDIIKKFPELDVEFQAPAHYPKYKYFQELQDLNLNKTWQTLPVPTLVVVGKADFVAGEEMQTSIGEESALIKVKKIEFLDHFLNASPNFEESIKNLENGGLLYPYSVDFNNVFIDFLEANK